MGDEKSAISQDTGQASYSRPAKTKLPENYTIRDGFLWKGDTPVSLVVSVIVEAAVQGFLHVDETEEYKTG
ncbi:hypothetical protein L9W92_14375 [Pelotomaculum terephthalicicum JT]|uniref:hypothetical protein n=1 Tax=Pelotomaculum terephthalicicum TaxID=206393 RepID=UPI001F041760|nr:hypothetical protein [Pelotomaculum terephthalicicum]MCG9969210.1 hypothetical protein [Pelotomaculum terephthalicicum JT]